MFRKMRRAGQELSQEECERMLAEGTEGVLAVLGDDGYPYTVPLNYLYEDGKIYFHSALEGHKVDAMKACDKVSFCVIGARDIVPEELTTYFRSVVAFGRARLLTGDSEIKKAAWALGEKYLKNNPARIERSVKTAPSRMGAYVIEIEHMTGKEAIELVRRKKGAVAQQ